jgi:putative membrane protein
MIEYSNEGVIGTLLCQWEGSVAPRALVMAIPPAMLTVILMLLNENVDGFQDSAGTADVKASQLWSAMFWALSFLIGFRTNKAYARFWDGTTLLHQMWGEWFDAASCLIAFSSLSMRKDSSIPDVLDFRHTLVRLMSLCHASALEEIAELDRTDTGYPVLDVGGLDQRSLRYLRDCKFNPDLDFNRVEVVIHMIQTLIVHYHDNGIIKIPPPILSRVFQTLSRGQVNLANCKKITSTLFPFPFAQMIGILLLVFDVLTPVMMASILDGRKFWAFFFTLIPVWALWSLNAIARELEMPFGDDPNDLPLFDFHEHMNTSLLMLIREETDLVPSIDLTTCHFEFKEMKKHIIGNRPKDFVREESAQSACSSIKTVSEEETTLDTSKGVRASASPIKADLGSASPPETNGSAIRVASGTEGLEQAVHLLALQLAHCTEVMSQFVDLANGTPGATWGALEQDIGTLDVELDDAMLARVATEAVNHSKHVSHAR